MSYASPSVRLRYIACAVAAQSCWALHGRHGLIKTETGYAAQRRESDGRRQGGAGSSGDTRGWACRA